MSFRFAASAIVLSLGLAILPPSGLTQESKGEKYRVLQGNESSLNVTTVKALISKGDKFVLKGDLDQARKSFDEARLISTQLLGFYRDLNGSFRGLDARIPREMDSKARRVQSQLATTNLRLAALFRKNNQPEVAVPLLIEVIRMMTPAKPEGQKAYQSLLELGFVDTPYAAMKRRS